jgi:hypothetical protein
VQSYGGHQTGTYEVAGEAEVRFVQCIRGRVQQNLDQQGLLTAARVNSIIELVTQMLRFRVLIEGKQAEMGGSPSRHVGVEGGGWCGRGKSGGRGDGVGVA